MIFQAHALVNSLTTTIFSLFISTAVFFLVVVDSIFPADCVYITFSVKVGNNIDYFAYDSPSNRFNNDEKRFQVRIDSGYQHYFHRNSPTYVS
jgi:hypothetical protein